jgi:PAS domain S-box-containing protein
MRKQRPDRNVAKKFFMENEDRFRTLLENSADAQSLSNGDVFIDCNNAALQMMCFSQKADILGHHSDEFSPSRQPDGSASLDKAGGMLSVAMDKGSHRFEWVHRRGDGTEFLTKVSLTTVTVNGKLLAHGVVRDVADRDRSQRALRETEARFKQLFDSMKTYLDMAGTLFSQSPPTPDISVINTTKKRAVGLAGSDKKIAQLRESHG